ncbi:MAG: excinuclease ABC subunit UvrC [Candidatus Scalindua sp. AMX11]|nr:MAG: excinuclease ABC subunit UvrC [Candidatus Scalindua sp.]NOG83146.1 excinuclease ABC subunit UvrC [Planctomycetota bacterium]RZV75841.1 MAG: excinuclease ABC subunit UvrC [Candidatus Scalindua sp. SCAELEC01]TDE64897.1 MAG: excinuclease ABC subunit UvrC [Candidatus Scalindua sp. AMX11]GJQ60365.1 MAG: UvrABC system protein C [Candidatus Scalindua sp.]
MVAEQNTVLSRKLKTIPTGAGVYLMKDSKSEVIYVGKAKILRNRVRSYFQASSDERLFVGFLVKRIADIEFVLTDTEKEALILENNLIKQFKPRFNINLRDDKTFVSIKLDLQEKFPYPVVVRQIEDPASSANGRNKKSKVLYFGPYSSTNSVREALRYINSLFPIRKCSKNVFRSRVRPCLYHQIGRCVAPCCDLIDEKSYKEILDDVILLLRGKNSDLVKVLKGKMERESEAKRYEMAAKIRDRIAAIEKTAERQKIHTIEFVDRDVFGYYKEGKDIQVQVMFIRNGNLENTASYRFSTLHNSRDEIFRSFLNQFYGQTRFIPDEVVVPIESSDKEILEELLSERKGKRVTVIFPKRGEKQKLLELAIRNAANAFKIHDVAGENIDAILGSLKRHLHLKNVPNRIECFDISNIGGKHSVGSLVTFEGGKPEKSKYKRYKVKTVMQSDDYGMMYEVLSRRYSRAFKEDDFPDLTVVDGGKGQLGMAVRVFEELGVDGVDVVALAKARSKGGESNDQKQRRYERVFICGNGEPIILDQESSELRLLQNARDEAHRFALDYHKKLRSKHYYVSPLDKISGIGSIKKKNLLKELGNMQGVRTASIDELKKVKSITRKDAEAIYGHFHNEVFKRNPVGK